MRFPEALTQAPILFLTGAGASVPLERFTTVQFLEHLLEGVAKEVFADGDPRTKAFRDALVGRARERPEDIEQLLTRLQAIIDATTTLLDDAGFAHFTRSNREQVSEYGEW